MPIMPICKLQSEIDIGSAFLGHLLFFSWEVRKPSE